MKPEENKKRHRFELPLKYLLPNDPIYSLFPEDITYTSIRLIDLLTKYISQSEILILKAFTENSFLLGHVLLRFCFKLQTALNII